MVEGELAGGVEQAELLNLLVRREQIAFNLIGKEAQAVLAGLTGFDTLPLGRQAQGNPAGQGLAVDGVDPNGDAGLLQCREPGALLLLTIKPRQQDQAHGVGAEMRAITLQGL